MSGRSRRRTSSTPNYVASLVATSKQPEAYKALLTFLDTPAAAKVFRSQGFEPS